MKKLLLFLLPLMMLCACETGPKTYRYKDIAFDYPGNYKIENESIDPDNDRCEVFLSKDGDNFIYLDNLHKTHYEVFSSTGQHLGEMSLNGDLDRLVADPGKHLRL